ncbi:hypothetical protein PM082_024339 [Marasmius tenuissimus]|nr:hypothetical protein PM082_024339 [Marasmius tenuissimus]
MAHSHKAKHWLNNALGSAPSSCRVLTVAHRVSFLGNPSLWIAPFELEWKIPGIAQRRRRKCYFGLCLTINPKASHSLLALTISCGTVRVVTRSARNAFNIRCGRPTFSTSQWGVGLGMLCTLQVGCRKDTIRNQQLTTPKLEGSSAGYISELL